MKKYILIFLILAISCTVTHTPKKKLDCEPVVPLCQPGKFAEVKFDTLSNQKTYFIVKKVESISSDDNEFALAFYNNNNVLLLFNLIRNIKNKIIISGIELLKEN